MKSQKTIARTLKHSKTQQNVKAQTFLKIRYLKNDVIMAARYTDSKRTKHKQKRRNDKK